MRHLYLSIEIGVEKNVNFFSGISLFVCRFNHAMIVHTHTPDSGHFQANADFLACLIADFQIHLNELWNIPNNKKLTHTHRRTNGLIPLADISLLIQDKYEELLGKRTCSDNFMSCNCYGSGSILFNVNKNIEVQFVCVLEICNLKTRGQSS